MVTGTAWVVRSEVVLAVAHSTVLVLLSGIGAVPVLSREILLWRAAYLASLGACLPLGHEGRGRASPVVHSWQPRSKARGPG